VAIAAVSYFIIFSVVTYFITPVTSDANDPELARVHEHIDFNHETGSLYINNEVIVMVYEHVPLESVATLAERINAEIVYAMEDIGFYQFRLERSMSYAELNGLIDTLKNDAIVENAFFNDVFELEHDSETSSEFTTAPPLIPRSDPWSGATWNVSRPGGPNWGMEAINAPGAWGYLYRMETVRVGLIDLLPNITHEDLTFAGVFVNGYSVDWDNTYTIRRLQHGTHVAGTMAAGFDNSVGVSGVMGNRSELYFSMWNGSYYTPFRYLIAIRALLDHDVQVINISQNTGRLVGFAASRGNRNAIRHLQDRATIMENALGRIINERQRDNRPDFVIVMSAGNTNNEIFWQNDWATFGFTEDPALWQTIAFWTAARGNVQARYNNFINLITLEQVRDRIIVVGSTGITNEKSDFSNIGARVDIVAPGEEIYSTVVAGYYGSGNGRDVSRGGYFRMCGTSMSAPHVSGVAGLIFASNPSLSGPEVKRIIMASTTQNIYFSDGHGGRMSRGLLNAERAVVNALQTQSLPVDQIIGGGVTFELYAFNRYIEILQLIASGTYDADFTIVMDISSTIPGQSMFSVTSGNVKSVVEGNITRSSTVMDVNLRGTGSTTMEMDMTIEDDVFTDVYIVVNGTHMPDFFDDSELDDLLNSLVSIPEITRDVIRYATVTEDIDGNTIISIITDGQAMVHFMNENVDMNLIGMLDRGNLHMADSMIKIITDSYGNPLLLALEMYLLVSVLGEDVDMSMTMEYIFNASGDDVVW